MRSVSCNLCGSNDYFPVVDISGFTIVKCRQCNLLFVNPRPEVEKASDYYTDIYYSYLNKSSDIGRTFYGEGSKKLFQEILCICKKFIPEGRLLDVGCGYGFFLRLMKESGYSVCGVDPSESACRFSNQEMDLKVTQGTLDNVSFPDNYFEIITMNNVLEHLDDPSFALRKAYSLLKPKGILIIVVPNLNFGKPLLAMRPVLEMSPSKVRSFIDSVTAKLALFHIPDHLYLFSPSTLSNMLIKAGLTKPILSNAPPILIPDRKLRTLWKISLYHMATFIEKITGRSLLVGHSLIGYCFKGNKN
jgi:2-polyprenyl-3-methyl-5-hydroxy-6-metoxy-1,4-benzoquinol methylase